MDENTEAAGRNVIDVFDKKWDMLVLLTVGVAGNARYSEIMNGLETINPKSLSETLKDLESKGVIERKLFDEVPLHTEYTLTPSGRELYIALGPLGKWFYDRDNEIPTTERNREIMRKALSSLFMLQNGVAD